MTPEQFYKITIAEDNEDYGLCPPPTDAQKALQILSDHFLGEDWYIVLSMCQEQCNTEIVCAILEKTQPSWGRRLVERGRKAWMKIVRVFSF